MNQNVTKPLVLLTGATGFLGRQIVNQLGKDSDYLLRTAVRKKSASQEGLLHEEVNVQDISLPMDWSSALKECDFIIHTAARAHIMNETAINPLHEYHAVNVDGTMNLARQAAAHGVKRFIFLSTIKVNGEETSLGNCYTSSDIPNPQDPYAISKYKAEKALQALALETGMEVVIIRPPMIYGPQVKGNFLRIINWLKRGFPLPLKAIKNKRSFVSVYNLVDLIIHCLNHPRAANQIFLVSDGEDVSIAELLSKTATAMNTSARLFTMPYGLMKALASGLGKQAELQRLCGSLQVDMSQTCEILNWKPKISIDDGLHRMF